MKYVYLVAMSAQPDDSHCQCHVLGAHHTLQSARRHFNIIHKDRLESRHFIKEYWFVDEPEIVPRGHPNKRMAAFFHRSWHTDAKTRFEDEMVTLIRWALSPAKETGKCH